MTKELRLTWQVQLVLRALLEGSEEGRYGLEIANAAGLKTGTLYPILARLEAAGWVDSRWEEIDAARAGRPARRYYRLSGQGRADAVAALERSAERLAPLRLRDLT